MNLDMNEISGINNMQDITNRITGFDNTELGDNKELGDYLGLVAFYKSSSPWSARGHCS
jgi:hypothetical protein